MRLEQSTHNVYDADIEDVYAYDLKGYAGDHSYLIGRTVGGERLTSYSAGQSFTSGVAGGIKVNVVSVGSSSAKVTITRSNNVINRDWVYVVPDYVFDYNNFRVGDTYSIVIGSEWTADSYAFQWYRNGSAISGATKQSYTLAAADIGKCFWVKVTGKSAGRTSKSLEYPLYSCFGNVLAGIIDQGNVRIDSSSSTLKAVPTGWSTPKLTYKYQWYRGSSKITGATASTYNPTTSDRGNLLKVSVTASRSGFPSKSAMSTAADYTLTANAAPVITGTPQVGQSLSVNTPTYSTVSGAAPSVTVGYQWYRSGSAISGATSSTHTLVAADYSTKTTVKVTGRLDGYIAHAQTSGSTSTVVKGQIAGALTAAVVTKTPGTLALTVALPGGSVTEASVKYRYQWYRGTTAITGATKSTYTMTSSDKRKDVKARVVVSKSNYVTVTLYSSAKNYSVATASSTAITGTAKVGEVISAPALVFTTSDGAASPTVTRQWYRDGTAISGQKGATYTLTSSDYTKYITVKTTAVLPGYLSYSATSPKTAKVGKGVLSGSKLAPVITQSEMTLTGALPVGSYTDTVSLSYQWYRNGAAISAATKSSYALTWSDYNKEINLRVTVSKSYYTTEKKYSFAKNYSVIPTPPTPLITGTIAQGYTIQVGIRDYVADGSVVTGSATLLHQWYRSGVAIPGATGSSYLLDAADLGKTITVKVSAAYSGYLPSSTTSAATQKIGASALAGHSDFLYSSNTIDPATKIVTAGPTGITEPGVTLAYQWYRGTSAISLATKSSYKLTSSDSNKDISVRVTTSKSGFTTVVKYSFKENYSVVPTGRPVISDTTPTRGQTLTVTLPTYSADGLAYAPAPEAISYQWYRSGTAISGTAAKQATYKPVTAEKGLTLSVKVTVSKFGFLSAATISSATSKVK
jgi:hypothetical protein